MSSSDGVTAVMHDLGGSGEPLVIAHATGFCGGAYTPLAAALRHHFHVWAIDFRSHGDATPTDALHWHRIADDLEAGIDAIGGGPVPVVGHSMGGACALLVAVRRPGAVRWAYVYEPIVFPPDHTGSSTLSESARRRRATFPSQADALHRYASRPPLDVLRADSLHAYVEHGFHRQPDGSVRLKCAPDHEAAVYASSGTITYDHLRRVDIPVTVAVGAVGEGFSPAALADAQVAALPHGRIERHATLGHFGPLQDPSGVAASILATAAG